MHWKAQSFNYLHYLNAPIEAVFQKIVSCMSSALQQHKTSVALGYLANWNIILYDKFFMSCLRTGKKKRGSSWWEASERSTKRFCIIFCIFFADILKARKKKIIEWLCERQGKKIPQRQYCSSCKFSSPAQSHRTTKAWNCHLPYCGELQCIAVGVSGIFFTSLGQLKKYCWPKLVTGRCCFHALLD